MFAPFLFIFLFTRFKREDSTVAQRAWMMAWIIASQVAGLVTRQLDPHLSAKPYPIGWILVISALATSSVGGFVVVARMLMESQQCV
jgi:branched-subunit amino acid ABC-type transport system permease component